jgi:hypothetical protein
MKLQTNSYKFLVNFKDSQASDHNNNARFTIEER